MDFRKKTKILKFVKIRPVRAKLFHADGQTDREMKLIVALRQVFFYSYSYSWV
jgi:hypothetical protein